MTDTPSRREALRALAALVAGAAVPAVALAQAERELGVPDLRGFARVAGLTFTDDQLEAALQDARSTLAGALPDLRERTDRYDLFPAEVFRVDGPPPQGEITVRLARPNPPEDPTWASVAELGVLLRAGRVSSRELTETALARLERHDPMLFCVVHLTPEQALAQADRADRELAAGRDRGPLHGIPYGLKDLFAVRGTPTQWGTAAFREQRLDFDAAVPRKLEEAGAVLVAKLSLGALAMNDNWFGGRTRNPWNPEEGSSGSSAGSASAVAAGLVPFAIGTETSGSIVSPCLRCRVTGLRPTFGSVSRAGAMALSWTMDKVGPIARTAEDCALVLSALLGSDPADAASVDRSFEYRTPRRLADLRIGVVGDPDPAALDVLTRAGAELVPAETPATPEALGFVIMVESAAMFDAITRDGRIDQVTENEWPAFFRAARFVPAVEYVQATRLRRVLMDEFQRLWGGFDAVVAPDHSPATIYASNLTGWPQLILPWGEGKSVSLLGRPWAEATLVGIGSILQGATDFHRLRPPGFE